MERIYRFITENKLLDKNDTVLAAVSGGPDSLLMLRALADLRAKYNLTLTVIHINHRLRGETADREAAYVAEICALWQIPCRIVQRDVAEYAITHHLSEEAAGHEVRYQVFREEMARLNADKLALGHHLNDRAESVLMHILKGCSPAGLVVLQAKQEKIIRPLLDFPKEEILNLCAAENIPYCTDSTNFETICLRNQLRLELLPYLRLKYNPEIDQALVRLSALAADDEDYFNKETDKSLHECAQISNDKAEIMLEIWCKYHIAIKRRILQSVWQKISGAQKLSYAQIEQILKLAEENCGEKKLALSGGWQIVKHYDKLFMQKVQKPNDEDYDYLWRWHDADLTLPTGVLRCTVVDTMSTDANFYQAFVDADKLSVTLGVRNRRAGDRMRPLGTGEKKLKDILIDKKIPLSLRDRLPLVISEGKIVWMAGIAVSEEFKVTAETKRIAHLTFESAK